MIRGIDVSENNGVIPQEVWNALKESGFDFAYIRCSYGRTGVDDMFIDNVKMAHNAGMLVGAYHYGYALTPEEAVEEAEHCKQIINDAGVILELPVFYDMEDADDYKAEHDFCFSVDNVTSICKNFIDNLYPLESGVYASYSWLDSLIDWRSLECAVWNAQWGNQDDFKGYVWQNSATFSFNGYTFDTDIMYIDKPE